MPVLSARAHKFLDPKHLRLGIERDRIVLGVTYDVDAGGDAKLLRGLFDRDSNGALDAAEQQKILDFLEETSFLWLSITVDGRKLSLKLLERSGLRLDLPAGSTQNLGLSAVYEARLSTAAAALEIVVADRDKDAAKRVPLIVDLMPGDEVAFASQGEWHPKLRQIHRIALGADAPFVLKVRRP